MSAPDWIFKRKQPDDTTRDPISGEFFATEAIKSSAEALMREGIQNSLDARLSGQTVRVRVRLGTAPERFVMPFVAGLRPHLTARNNGLRPSHVPDLNAPCRYLTFEDFGTRGLEGDPLQWHKVRDRTNGFFAFFRAEGESDKTASDRRGRWGVGKFVFPRASFGSTFFGLTRRAEDGRVLLLGRSILKTHQVGSHYHVPDGYFGVPRAVPGGTIVGPVEDAAFIESLSLVFSIDRTTEPGLSLVVPWYDSEITFAALVEAAAKDWFFSILAGELEITIAAEGEEELLLSRDTLSEVLLHLPQKLAEDLEPLLALSRFAIDSGRNPVVIGPADVRNAPSWTETMIAPAQVEHLRLQLADEEAIAVRIPITVRPKNKPAQQSHFDVFVQKDANADSGLPVFIREGIIVSDARGGRARGYRSIVIASDKAIADLLGDAENPSHTEWRPDTANFKDKYTYGPGYLKFVKDSVRELVQRVLETADDSAPDLLTDIFALPDTGKPRLPDKKRVRGDDPDRVPPIPAPPPKRFRISRIDGGFAITRGDEAAVPPSTIEVSIAYDVRRGDPFKKYRTFDFDLVADKLPDIRRIAGLRVQTMGPNQIVFVVTSSDFHAAIEGFDHNRDLIVKASGRGEFNDHAPD